MPIEVKICGLSTPGTVAAAVDGGARFVGFVFYPPSPRCVSPERAAELGADVPASVTRVGLVVDADDQTLDGIVSAAGLDMLQLHGMETVERVQEIKARFGVAVMKVVRMAGPRDVTAARAFEDVADRLLFDARPPDGATRPGGNALAFDWDLLEGQRWRRPWMLAGGLTAGNLAQAVRVSGAGAVDVSSGVEAAPGVKSAEKIRAFLEAAAGL